MTLHLWCWQLDFIRGRQQVERYLACRGGSAGRSLLDGVVPEMWSSRAGSISSEAPEVRRRPASIHGLERGPASWTYAFTGETCFVARDERNMNGLKTLRVHRPRHAVFGASLLMLCLSIVGCQIEPLPYQPE